MDTLAASIDAFIAPLASALSAFVFFRSQFWSTGAASCGLARHWCALFYALPSIHQYQGFGWQFVTCGVTSRTHQPRVKSVTLER